MVLWRSGAAAALVLLLAGCAAAPALPPRLSEGEVAALMAEQNAAYWEQIAPGEPMPVVEPIEYLAPDDYGAHIQRCLRESGPPGSLSLVAGDDAHIAAARRLEFVCRLRYPLDVSEPEALGLFSEAQLQYFDSYAVTRLVPCLEMLGYSAGDPPNPYLGMSPVPADADEWRRVDLRCPPPPYLSRFRPTTERFSPRG